MLGVLALKFEALVLCWIHNLKVIEKLQDTYLTVKRQIPYSLQETFVMN